MKKINTLILAGLLIISFALSSCFGSFSLTNKVYDFNKGLGNKFIQSVGLWVMVIVPIYQVSMFLDGVVFNLIEFWTGSNPLAMKAGQSETQMVYSNGNTYEVTATHNQFHITQMDGEKKGKVSKLQYHPNDGLWYAVSEGKEVCIGQHLAGRIGG